MDNGVETVIIGGGISGLACARALHDAGRRFLLLTDRLGGRMESVPGSGAPLGATYVTTDYRHAGRYVARGPRVRKRDVYFPDGDRFVTIFDPRNVRHAAALARLYSALIRFRAHLNRLRRQAPSRCQAELLAADPLLTRLVRQPAAEFIRENRLQELHRVFAGPMVHSTIFVEPASVNTFYYLACLFPALLDIYLADFSHTLARLTAGYGRCIVRGRVVQLENEGERGYRVTLDGGRELWGENVVVTTPCPDTRRFCPELDTARDNVREVPFCTLHVAGRRRRRYVPGKTVFLPPGEPATVLFPLPDGNDLLFAATTGPDLSRYYDEWRVVRALRWQTAVQLTGADWRPLRPLPHLFTIGDYNICGLEDSFLTGLFAANHIIRRPAARTMHEQPAL